jgi:hypothetical protein
MRSLLNVAVVGLKRQRAILIYVLIFVLSHRLLISYLRAWQIVRKSTFLDHGVAAGHSPD